MVGRHCPKLPVLLEVEAINDLVTQDMIVRVEFQRLNIAIGHSELRRGFSAAGSEIIHRSAHALARKHAAEVEQVILRCP